MKKYSKRVLTLLLSLVLMFSMSAGIVFADDGSGETTAAEAYSASITVVDGEGTEFEITGADIQNAEAVEVSAEEPWKFNGTTECFGEFYSLKSVLNNAGITDLSDAHGIKAVASDGFVTGYSEDLIEDLYIFDESKVSRGGEYGEAGKYGLGIKDTEGTTAGNKWARDIVSVGVAKDHVWFIKKGACRHFCTICNANEPSIVINPHSENPVTVHDCEIKAADAVEVTEAEPWTYGKNQAFGTFHSLKSVLAAAGVDYAEAHGLKAVSTDGFVTGFSKEDIDNLYLFDMSEVSRGGKYGAAGTYGTAINGSAGNKWAKEIASFELADSHVAFVKEGITYDYCTICGENILEVAGLDNVTYTGKELKPATVKIGDSVLTEGTDYEAAYENNVNAGTATVTIKGLESSSYKLSGDVTKEFTINKAAAKLKKFVPSKTKTYKAKKSTKKLAKKRTFKISATAANGAKVTSFSKKSVNKYSKYFTVSKKGKVTVKKGLKKGTYKLKVNVKVAATANSKAGTVVKTITIKVK